MNHARFVALVASQFDATLDMLEECLRNCPAKQWNAKVAKYEFWHVAYHALYCTDLYTAKTEHAWAPHKRFHPKGRDELVGEYPSREFSKRELLAYLKHTRALVHASLARETSRTLAGPSGFSWVPVTRAELAIYSMRHVQHHAGQLGALLRRAKVKTKWKIRGAAKK